jgi:hypothetical protein
MIWTGTVPQSGLSSDGQQQMHARSQSSDGDMQIVAYVEARKAEMSASRWEMVLITGLYQIHPFGFATRRRSRQTVFSTPHVTTSNRISPESSFPSCFKQLLVEVELVAVYSQ